MVDFVIRGTPPLHRVLGIFRGQRLTLQPGGRRDTLPGWGFDC
jgi:hypothetical protein